MKVTYVDHMGGDHSVVNAARVSFKKLAANYTQDQNDKLIRYLAKHQHTSPFNHTFITMHVKAPIFVARQLVKHRFMPWNEVSRRYVDDEPEFYEPEVWRKRAETVKQGSSDEGIDAECFVAEEYEDFLLYQASHIYKLLLREGVAPEQARMVLPQSTYTEWYWSGTLGAWADMYKLRIDAHAQKETQEVAKQAGDILKGLYPVSWEALVGTSQ